MREISAKMKVDYWLELCDWKISFESVILGITNPSFI